jgi:putative ABC transport system permease protein
MLNLSSLRESFAIATRAIWSQKVRAVLTTLGIVIGILAVTAMATVVNGIEQGFENDIATLGTDVVYVEKWPWRPTTDWWNYINRPNMDESLGDDLEQRSSFVSAAVAVVGTSALVSSTYHTLPSVSVRGAEYDYLDVHPTDLAEGYFFGEYQERAVMHVAVVGYDIAESLFPNSVALGKDIRIDGSRFQIIGIIERQGTGTGGGNSEDNQITIPYSTFKKLFGIQWRDVSVHARITGSDDLEEAKDEFTGILRVSRRLDAKEPNDFELNDMASLRETMRPIKTAIYSIGIGLTALSLLVGGIGVMNIMFVSVKERTREIGVRKAVGAKSSNILTQFLIEAIIVCSIGGAIGILLALPISMLVSMILPSSLDATVVMIAFGICVLIGTVFGLAPAWTAAKSEPIDALRYE